MKLLSRDTANITTNFPIKIVQFGEGNFLRAFADWMIDVLNEKADFNAGVAVVQPIEHGLVDLLEKQEGLYHLLMRGLSNGQVKNEQRLISCIQRTLNPFTDPDAYLELARIPELSLILSNTTEAGIVFDADDNPDNGVLAKTFPGKLTQFLLARYHHFEGAADSGVGIIPCELIDRNGDKLFQAILQYVELWGLSKEFGRWVQDSNYFANTLVDRIVPGYPREEIDEIKQELGYDDQLVVASELFHLWIIEGPQALQEIFPAHKFGLNVKYVNDQTPYRSRKVRILNGAHTSMVPVGLLAGIETVKEAVEDSVLGPFIGELIFEEIIPTMDLPEEELDQFANDVIERFRNPFIRHELKSISLNSISKFKVRVLPSILGYLSEKNRAPIRLCTAFASLIKLYLTADSIGIALNDDQKYLEFFNSRRQETDIELLISTILSNTDFWGQDLTKYPLLMDAVINAYEKLVQQPINESIEMIQSS
ncbi:MAG: altronate oxidoreductase [Cyclobacteriaceae bacterium]|nr:MAG: altronate oxidoreductase [Cyclobacteriaceae bacterium]